MNGRTRLAPISRQHLLRWALPAIVACMALVGCGGGGTASSSSSASSGSPSSSSAGATQSAGLSALQTCLKAHGVTIRPRASFSPGASFSPRPFPSGSGFPTAFPSGGFLGGGGGGFLGGAGAANSAAFKACQKYAPKGFRLGGGILGGGTINASVIAAFKSCMSQNGVTVTSTDFASLAKLARSSKKAAAAVNTCRVLLVQGFSRPTPSPTAT